MHKNPKSAVANLKGNSHTLGKKIQKSERNNGKHRYLSHLKFATGHYDNLKPKEGKKENHCKREHDCVMSWKSLAGPQVAPTSVLYSHSILKKSNKVWGNGP